MNWSLFYDLREREKKKERVFDLMLFIYCPIPLRYCWHLQKFDYTKIFFFMVGSICGKKYTVNLSSYLVKYQGGGQDPQH